MTTPNTAGPGYSWRLVHNGTDVLALMETSGITTTLHTIFEASTEQECLAEIARLNITYEKPQE